MTRTARLFFVLLIALAAPVALPPAFADDRLILPDSALLRGQQALRRAEQEGAAVMTPGAVLTVQQSINAAWSAYHRQVEEEADDPEDDEAILAHQLAEEAELDAELLLVTVRTQRDESRLDGLRAERRLPPVERLEVPPPEAHPATRGAH